MASAHFVPKLLIQWEKPTVLWKHHWQRGNHGHKSNSGKGKSGTYKAQPCALQAGSLHFQQECLLFQIYSSTIIHEEFHGSLQAGLMKANDYSLSRIRQANFIHLGLYISVNLKSKSASLSACATTSVRENMVSCFCPKGSCQNCHKLIQKHFNGWKWW